MPDRGGADTARVDDFIAALNPPRRDDARALDSLFRAVTGWQPVLWGKRIGYGRYHYCYDSGREGDFHATGFGINAREIAVYILPGYGDFPDIAARLGPYRRGKSCWYIRDLNRIDRDALRDLIRAGLDDLAALYPIEPT